MSSNSNENSNESTFSSFIIFSSLLFITLATTVVLGANLPLMAFLFLALESLGFLYIKATKDLK